jgi:hypothetical protein
MEELRSTEVLDREILEDARKKAYRILKAADETIKSRREDWEKKIQEAVAGIRQKYADRLVKTREEIMARLPLDKRRARSEKIETLLRDAMEAYLGALGRDRLLALLEEELRKRLAICDEFTGAQSLDDLKPELMFRLLSREEGVRIFKNALPPGIAAKLDARREPWLVKEGDSAFATAGKFPAVAVNTGDLRISASIDAAAAVLLEDSRAELAGALLGNLEDLRGASL